MTASLTLLEFVNRSWNNINKKAINGRYAYDKDDPSPPAYVKYQILIKITHQELYVWCIDNWQTIKDFIDEGKKPMLARIDRKGHYQSDNLKITNSVGCSAPTKSIKGTSLRNGEVRYYESLTAAEKDGFDITLISKACRGVRETHGGFKWEYVIND